MLSLFALAPLYIMDAFVLDHGYYERNYLHEYGERNLDSANNSHENIDVQEIWIELLLFWGLNHLMPLQLLVVSSLRILNWRTCGRREGGGKRVTNIKIINNLIETMRILYKRKNQLCYFIIL